MTETAERPGTPDAFDVAVVGAGIVGLMAAFALQRAGRRVLVLDRGGIAEGASFGNAAALAFSDILPLASPGIVRQAPRWLADPLGPLAVPPAYALAVAPWLWRFLRSSNRAAFARGAAAQGALMRLARAEMERAVAGIGLSDMLRADGCLEVFENEAAFAAQRSDWELRARENIAFRFVGRLEIEALQPGLAPGFARGVFVPDWQTVCEPHRFARRVAEHVLAHGGAFRQASVARIEPAGTKGVALHLAGGARIVAAQAVLACGAWSKTLAAGLGDRVPLETERGYNTTLPPNSFALRRQLVFAEHGFVVTPLETGVRVGGAVELGGLKRPPDFRRAKAMLAKAKRFLPALRTENGREWMGFRPSMPDSLPVIGRARSTPRVVYAFGHGHLGLTQSAATGRLVCDLVCGHSPAIDVSPFRPSRFSRNG